MCVCACVYVIQADCCCIERNAPNQSLRSLCVSGAQKNKQSEHKHFAAWLFYTYSFTRFTLTWYAICSGVWLCYACRIALFILFYSRFYSIRFQRCFCTQSRLHMKCVAPANDKYWTSWTKNSRERWSLTNESVCTHVVHLLLCIHPNRMIAGQWLNCIDIYAVCSSWYDGPGDVCT